MLLAAVGTVALGYVLTLYGPRFARAGAVYEYLVCGTHPAIEIVGAGVYVIGLLLLGAGGGFVAETRSRSSLRASRRGTRCFTASSSPSRCSSVLRRRRRWARSKAAAPLDPGGDARVDRLCASFYLLVTYAGAIGFGSAALANGAWFTSRNPFGELGQRYVPHMLGPIVSVRLVLDLFSVCVAFMLAASRVLMTLARDSLLPAVLGRTTRRFHPPVGGLAAIVLWAPVVVGSTALAGYGQAAHTPRVLESLLILLAAGSYLIMFVYLLLAFGCVRLVRLHPRKRAAW